MKPLPTIPAHRSQQGFVLILALIVLAAMTLAATALVRSVDTTTQLARNLSFKRDATNRSDIAVEHAIQLFRDGQFFAQGNNTTATHANRNYSAVVLPTDSDGVPTILKSSGFTGTWTAPAVTIGSANLEGMNVTYLIERMCSRTGPSNADNCVLGAAISEGGTAIGNRPSTVVPALFRVTARVTGPRNTISYVQTTFTLQIT